MTEPYSNELRVESGVVNEGASGSKLDSYINEEMEGSSSISSIQQEGEQEQAKRGLDETSFEEEWNTVRSHSHIRKIMRRSSKEDTEKIQVYVTCSSGLPKQFALAKLLRDNNIKGISEVKYIHHQKIMITFEEKEEADLFIQSKTFADLEWRCHKSSEVGLSYGLIRNIDLEMSEEEIMKNITCQYEIASARRLNQRKYNENDIASGWEKCETIRLAFRGTSVPTSVLIYGMRVKVAPYVFPTTQCSRCWKFGHTRILCPSKKIVCPKCTKNHESCEVTEFRCINCTGPHMAMQKICPVFKKERRVRELMSEYNCTYRKALEMYVPPSPVPERSFSPGPPLPEVRRPQPVPHVPESNTIHSVSEKPARKVKLMSDLFTSTEENSFTPVISRKKAQAQRKLQKRSQNPAPPVMSPMETENNVESEGSDDASYTARNPSPRPHRGSECVKDLTFLRLLTKLYTIVIGRDSLEAKIQQVVSILGEWILVNVVSGVSAGSLLSMFTKYG